MKLSFKLVLILILLEISFEECLAKKNPKSTDIHFDSFSALMHHQSLSPITGRLNSKSFTSTQSVSSSTRDILPEDCPSSDLPQVEKSPLLGDCFEKRKQVSTDSTNDSQYTDEEVLKADVEVCQCHSQSLPKMISQDAPLPLQSLKYDLIRARISERMVEAEQLSNSMMIQAHLLTSGLVLDGELSKDEHLNLVAKYKAKMDEDAQKIESFKEKLKTHAGKFDSQKIDFQRTVDSIDLPKSQISFSAFPMNEIPKNPANSCFSMKTFFEVDMLPHKLEDKTFLSYLGSLETIRPQDWDLENLKRQYNDANSENDHEKLEKIKGQIKFVKKNPLYANLFASTDTEVRNSQQELLSLLKKKYAPISCDLKEASCISKIQEEKKQFEKKASEIFKRPEVFAATREVLNEGILRTYDDPNELIQDKLPRTQSGLESLLAKSSSNNFSVSQCRSGMSIETRDNCLTEFSRYCSVLREIVDTETQQISSQMSPADEFLMTIQSNFSLNPMNNEGFKELTNKICSTQRFRKNPQTGKFEVTTFKSYKDHFIEENCGFLKGATSSIGSVFGRELTESQMACKDENLMISLYLRDFEYVNDPETNGNIREFNQHFISAFAQSSSKEEKVIDKKDEEKLNTYTVSNTEIKKYGAQSAFNNSYQEIPSAAVGNSGSTESSNFNLPQSTQFIAPIPSSASLLPSSEESNSMSDRGKENIEQPTNLKKMSREDIEEELFKTKSNLDSAQNVAEIERMNARIRELEQMLAKKDDDFKKLLDERLQDKVSKEENTDLPNKKITNQAEESNSPSEVKASNGSQGGLSQSGRTPASSGGGNFPGIPQVGASSNGISSIIPRESEAQFNDALLAKYGIVIDRNSYGASVVARESDADGLIKLSEIYNEQEKSSLISAVVSDKQYEKLKSHDLSSLNTLYEKKMKGLGDQVTKLKVSTSTNEEESLEYYVIKEGDTVVFQPVRRYTRENLLEAITN